MYKKKIIKSLARESDGWCYVTLSKHGIRKYPIEVRANAGIYPRISGFTAANPPGYYPDVDPPAVGELMQQRTARVTLKEEEMIHRT